MSLTEKQKESQRKHYQKKKSLGILRTDDVRKRELEYNRKYRQAHKELFIAQRARRKQLHSDEIHTWEKGWRENNKEKIHKYQVKWRTGKAAYDSAKARAKRDCIEFTISRAYVDSITPTHCPVLGMDLRRGGGKGPTDCSFSIDRLVGEKGYVAGNIIIVSNRANRLRSDSTPEELRRVAAFYEKLLSN